MQLILEIPFGLPTLGQSFIKPVRFILIFTRLEQQALHLVDKVKSLGPKLYELAKEEGELDARQQVSTLHVEFLVNMSRATRRRDWAWFEIAESELQKLYVSFIIIIIIICVIICIYLYLLL